MNKTGVANNAAWIAVSQFTRVGVQVAGIVILARLLSPKDYGVMAMATVILNLANLLRDMGTAAAIVQRNKVDDPMLSTIFWTNITFGLLLFLLVTLSADLISTFFENLDLATLLLWLSLVFPIASLGAVHQALLERSSNFKILARIEIVASVSGLCAVLLAAQRGAGATSLVIQTLTTATVSTVQLWAASKWLPKFSWASSQWSSLFSYSGNLAAFNLINFFSRNSDSFIIGKYLGENALGIYSQGYRIMLFPLQNMTFIFTRALFPVLSRAQASPSKGAHLYLNCVTIIILVTAPTMGIMWVLRQEFVLVVFGKKWIDVVPILYWLIPTGFIQSIVSTTGTAFMASGRTKTLLYLGIFAAMLQVSAFFLGLKYGIIGVAEYYFFANLLNFFIAMHFTMKIFNENIFLLFKRTYLVMLPALVSIVISLMVRWALIEKNVDSVFIRSSIIIATGLSIYLMLGLHHFLNVVHSFRASKNYAGI